MAETQPNAPVETSAITDPFQNQKRLRAILKQAQVTPSARKGQAFLIERHLMEKLVASAELGKQDLVIEVGTGTGGLTGYLLGPAGHVISVEIDSRLRALAHRELGDQPELTLMGCDVLKNKHELNPEVVNAVTEQWKTGRFERLKLVANLPYAVASPMVADMLDFEPRLERMCFTVQYEVGQRLTAEPGSRDYGWLSILVQSLASIETITQVPASCFYPRPKIDSTILRVIPKTERPEPERLRHIAELVQYLFQHRRKMALGSLRRFQELSGQAWTAEEILEECGIDGNLRPENLDVETFWRLSDTILKRPKKGE